MIRPERASALDLGTLECRSLEVNVISRVGKRRGQWENRAGQERLRNSARGRRQRAFVVQATTCIVMSIIGNRICEIAVVKFNRWDRG